MPPEEASATIRSLLRTAVTLRGNAFYADANDKEAKAKELFVELVNCLKRRIIRYAGAAPRDQSTIDDTSSEITLELWRRMSNLSPTYDLLESRFNVVFKTAALTAVRTHRRQNGLDKNGRPDSGDLIMLSLEESASNSGNEEGGRDLSEIIADPSSFEPIDQLLGDMVVSVAKPIEVLHRRRGLESYCSYQAFLPLFIQ